MCEKTCVVMIPLLNSAGAIMKRFVEGADRGQSTLLPECLDDWIDEEQSGSRDRCVRRRARSRRTRVRGSSRRRRAGPPIHPSILLKLYIYGYLNRVQSSRRLEREAGRNLEVMWLLGRLVPDHKTIADFRKDNGAAFARCAQFVELCREMGLLATASVAIDGSKFKAVNNRDKNFTKGKVERRRAAAGGERRPLSCPARHDRPAGADGGACCQDEASQGEAGQAQGRDGQAVRV